MRLIIGFFIVVFFVSPLLAAAEEPPTTPKEYKIVIHSENAVSELSDEELAEIYLGKRVSWDSGEKITPAMSSYKDPVTPIFLKKVARKSVGTYRKYWKRRALTGRGTTPKTFDTSAELLAFVGANPGAIGIVGTSVNINTADASIKELGKTSMEGVLTSPPGQTQSGSEGEGELVSDPEVADGTVEGKIFRQFVSNVWPHIEHRCAGCHSQRSPNLEQIIDIPIDNFRWCFDTPRETFQSIVDHGYVDPEVSEDSFLLIKPTEQTYHGGGEQIPTGSRDYKEIRQWVENYAAVENGEYETVDELPDLHSIESVRSEIWLQIKPTPEAWADTLLAVVVFPFDEATGEFSATPVAVADSRVIGKKALWQQPLYLYIPDDDSEARKLRQSQRLPAGRYRLKFFCDIERRLDEEWDVELTDSEFFAGETDIDASWEIGGKHKTLISFPEESLDQDAEPIATSTSNP